MPKISSSNGVVQKQWDNGNSSLGKEIYRDCKINEVKSIDL